MNTIETVPAIRIKRVNTDPVIAPKRFNCPRTESGERIELPEGATGIYVNMISLSIANRRIKEMGAYIERLHEELTQLRYALDSQKPMADAVYARLVNDPGAADLREILQSIAEQFVKEKV